MKLNHLQILRAIAALLVCCFHLRDRLNVEGTHWGDKLFLNGGIGVPIFFIISGFIMVFTGKKYGLSPSSDISDFLKKRIIRIVPLYYILTLAWMVLGGTFMVYFSGKGFERLYQSLLFLPSTKHQPVLFLGWSLNYEMFFYLVFALSLLFRKYRYHVLIAAFLILIALGIYFKPQQAWLKMATSFSNLLFLTGVLFGLVFDRFAIKDNQSKTFAVLGILLFTGFYFLFPKNENPLVVAALVMATLLLDKVQFPASRFLVKLGDMSYSIYLCHPFVGILFRRFKTATLGSSVAVFILEIATVILMSYFCYRFIEKPATAYLKKKI